jgi:hypothetical protein
MHAAQDTGSGRSACVGTNHLRDSIVSMQSSALTSWPSINIPAVATFSALFARLDPDPRVRGKQFEHFCKWFLANDPTCKNTNP